MSHVEITEQIKYIGADDKTLDLFESQYLIPNGVSYNSYLILDEKIAVMDTVDMRATGEWLRNMDRELQGKEPDYLVVAEGDTLNLGKHTLQFFMAPMVHWPEVMVTYEQSEKILFSADGFGTFGSLDANEEWIAEARKYYINIVGKYGNPVQALLKKASGLDIQMICPLHGPVLKENLGYYIEKYQIWSSYGPEEEGILIAYASIHGNTKQAAEKMRDILIEKGAKNVVIMDLSRDDMARAVENAFRYSKMVLACATYDGGIFPCMEDFLNHLKAKNYQKRTVAFMENGSWAPAAAKLMKGMLEKQKDLTIVEPVVTIRSTMKPETVGVMEELADALL